MHGVQGIDARPRRRRGVRRQAGQSMLEYAMIVVFVAMAGYAAWSNFGVQIRDLIRVSGDAVGGMQDVITDGQTLGN